MFSESMLTVSKRLFACLAVSALAAFAASHAAAANLPATIAATQDLSFGSFAAGTGGTVVISTAGARSATGGVRLLSAFPGAAAQFTVRDPQGGPGTYSITLPTTVTLSNGASNMTITNITSSPAAGSKTGMLTNGSQILAVGGTLTVGNAQPTGKYTGTLSVTINQP